MGIKPITAELNIKVNIIQQQFFPHSEIDLGKTLL